MTAIDRLPSNRSNADRELASQLKLDSIISGDIIGMCAFPKITQKETDTQKSGKNELILLISGGDGDSS